jgi:hypothetical protein
LQIKTLSRIHKVARLVVAGIKNDRIAVIVGLTPSGLASLMQRQDYKEIEQEILAGAITQLDQQLALDVEAMKQEFAVGIPAAMRTLVETVTQRRDLKAAIEASKELLDRDPKQTFVRPRDRTLVDQEHLVPQGVLDSMSKLEQETVAQLAKPRDPKSIN